MARVFFALYIRERGVPCQPLNPYSRLTQQESKKQYQLRVFVNVENSHFLVPVGGAAHDYYYRQVWYAYVCVLISRTLCELLYNSSLYMCNDSIHTHTHTHTHTHIHHMHIYTHTHNNEHTHTYTLSLHMQVRNDFIEDLLLPRVTINSAVWMAAIDMAREAKKRNQRFEDLQ